MSSSGDPVRYERDGALAIITFARPENRNSMTPDVLDAFAAASARARTDDALCVVITGSGTTFSAGADFRSIVQREGDTRAPNERSYAMYEPFLSVLDIPVPVIGALNGHAVGGGFGLSLVCDLRIAAHEGKYGANFTKLGLAPGMSISYLLPRLVGLPRANELLFTGRLVDGREAEAIGLVNRAVPAADVLPTALAMAREIAANAPYAVRATKTAIRRGLDLHIREAAQVEAFAQAESLAMEDSKIGIAALLAKQPPKFTGR